MEIISPSKLFLLVLSGGCAVAISLLLIGFVCIACFACWFALIAPKQKPSDSS